MNPLFNVMGHVLAWFYSVAPNYGVAIIFLTIVIRLLLFPLTAKQAKSMIAMQRIQPELKKLQQKYKGDRQKLNEEMMKFYKENKVNPLGVAFPCSCSFLSSGPCTASSSTCRSTCPRRRACTPTCAPGENARSRWICRSWV